MLTDGCCAETMEALKREITLAKAPLIQLQASSRTNTQEIDKNLQDKARERHCESSINSVACSVLKLFCHVTGCAEAEDSRREGQGLRDGTCLPLASSCSCSIIVQVQHLPGGSKMCCVVAAGRC